MFVVNCCRLVSSSAGYIACWFNGTGHANVAVIVIVFSVLWMPRCEEKLLVGFTGYRRKSHNILD